MSAHPQAAPVITVDGPGGVGKGTLCARLALQLGWHLLDSGALYRVTALAARRGGIALDDAAGLARVAAQLEVTFEPDPVGGLCVRLAGDDVTEIIRRESGGEDASVVAAVPAVRAALLQRQRDFRRPPGLVADGRDMGTVVFPDAPVKLFLTASPAERARRRYNQLREKGASVSLSALERDIAVRDARDTTRQAAPLQPAADAEILDTTCLDIEEVVTLAWAIIAGRLGPHLV